MEHSGVVVVTVVKKYVGEDEVSVQGRQDGKVEKEIKFRGHLRLVVT